MSKIEETRWHNPFTSHGLRFTGAAEATSFRIHEAGVMMLSADWHFTKVCSPFWRIFANSSPGAWVESGGVRHSVEAGRLIVIPDGVTFSCGCEPGAEHLWIHFSLPSRMPVRLAGVVALATDSSIDATLHSLRIAAIEKAELKTFHLSAGLVHLAFAGMERAWGRLPGERLERIFTWIDQNLGQPITNEKLAAQAGLGVESFIRWFKQQTERTPASFVAEWRVREACRYLAVEEHSIEQVAATLGFSNRNHFSRVFKQYAGCGPAAFRQGKSTR